MTDSGLFSISEFAKYSRTTRDTLLHYDRIGLLPPTSRGENNYRFYSGEQLITIYIIRALQQLGMPLEEIRDIIKRGAPENSNELFEQQIALIDKKIDEWVRARKLLYLIRDMIQSTSNIDENEITIQYLPAQAIILGNLNDYSRDRTFLDAYSCFYQDMSERYPDLDLHYPVWPMFSEQSLRQGNFSKPDRFYFYNPEGHDKKPAALYTIGYTHGGLEQIYELYVRLNQYIDNNGFEICGSAYEEYLIKETFLEEGSNYIIKVMITVREK